MGRFEDVRVELRTTGIDRVTLGDRDITGSVRGVVVRAAPHMVTEVELDLVAGTVELDLDVADVTVGQGPDR